MKNIGQLISIEMNRLSVGEHFYEIAGLRISKARLFSMFKEKEASLEDKMIYGR